jgi:hypothetical protein
MNDISDRTLWSMPERKNVTGEILSLKVFDNRRNFECARGDALLRALDARDSEFRARGRK